MEAETGVKRSSDQNGNYNPKKLKVDLNSVKTLVEKDVGITQYINSDTSTGFLGLLKQRYSDFMVNEIDLNGNVVHLLDDGIDLGKTRKERQLERRQKERAELQDKTPEEIAQIKEQKRLEEEQKQAEAERAPSFELSDDNRAKLLELITEKEIENIKEIFSTGGNTETETKFDDKITRTKLHQTLREAFQGKLETSTSPENTFKITLARNIPARQRRNPQESINHVDENGVVNYGLGPFKNYLHFTVYKENRETMEVASTISKFLRIPPKNIRYGGTKDRRGVTCQRFSIHKGKVARVSLLNKGLKNIVLGGFSYEDQSLELGDLKGNEFLITMRDVKPLVEGQSVEDLVKSGFETLSNKGFINYYGMQRFGTFSNSTHTYGLRLLKEDWKGAAELLLAEQEIVVPDSIEARRIWAETSNPTLALQKMPSRCSAEYSILKTLTKEKLNEDEEYGVQSYYKSIMSIPRNLRTMYIHAYQSFIWNMVASKRIELFGLDLIEGDIVLVKDDAPVELDENGDVFEEDVVSSKTIKAKHLTKEDISSGKYTIYDVVLPTPGFDVLYPKQEELEQVYVKEMAKDGLDPYNMTRKIREFSLSGSYRSLMGKPTLVEYEIVKYSEEGIPLVRTDYEILAAKKKGETLERIIKPELGDKTAVVLKMQLGVSTYATMALREFMKVDTGRFSDSLNVSIE